MKKLLFIFLLCSCAFGQLPSNEIDLGNAPRIINGAAEPTEQLPVGALARFDSALICTLNILSPKVAITAAHCVQDFETSELYIGVGKNHYKNRQVTDAIPIFAIEMHPDYNRTLITDDIAILIAGSDMLIPHYAKVIDADMAGSSFPRICGWGNTARPEDIENYPETIHCAPANVLGDTECSKRIGLFDFNEMICVDEMVTGASSGDSGGSLFFQLPTEKYALAGVTSKGVDTDYGGYTEIHSYLPWINDTLAKYNLEAITTIQFDGSIGIMQPSTGGNIEVPDIQDTFNLIAALLQTLVPIIAFLWFSLRLGVPWMEAARKSLHVRTWKQLADELVRDAEIDRRNGVIDTGEKAGAQVERSLIDNGCPSDDAKCYTQAAYKRMLEIEGNANSVSSNAKASKRIENVKG